MHALVALEFILFEEFLNFTMKRVRHNSLLELFKSRNFEQYPLQLKDHLRATELGLLSVIILPFYSFYLALSKLQLQLQLRKIELNTWFPPSNSHILLQIIYIL
ncbi:hypothetical protein, partial [Bacillus sp. AFS001701]|uniref:hypothetical protein n=1 Tax=Bacillus sp. AFS001701 TaxID=2033480 RepID=UPI001C3EB56B